MNFNEEEGIMEADMSIKRQIREYIAENVLLGDGDALEENVSFQESGILDSTGFLGLITFVEGKFGIEILDEELDPENLETLCKISSFVEKKVGEREAV
jgi:acyl carrier protein